MQCNTWYGHVADSATKQLPELLQGSNVRVAGREEQIGDAQEALASPAVHMPCKCLKMVEDMPLSEMRA